MLASTISGLNGTTAHAASAGIKAMTGASTNRNLFAPDGTIYMTASGAAGRTAANDPRKLDTVAGKVIRLKDDGTVPPDIGQLLHTTPGDNCPICRQRAEMQPSPNGL